VYDLGEIAVTKRGRLPHWQAKHAIYFVTWHLAEALPASVIARLRAERDAEYKRIVSTRGSLTWAERRSIEVALIDECQRFLDAQPGVLGDHRAAQIVHDSLLHFDGERYFLYAWCVMPSHVHVVFSATDGHKLSEIQHSLKGFTSREINKLLGRSGQLWQPEAFDRCIRDAEEFKRTVEYVVNNPVKAALRDWPFVQTYPDRIATVI
jgi:REP element-mobilizing transposase RayT